MTYLFLNLIYSTNAPHILVYLTELLQVYDFVSNSPFQSNFKNTHPFSFVGGHCLSF